MSRNYSIDKLKIIASYAVVFMHVVNYLPTTRFANYWTYDWYFPILDLAVPLFFVFSGYFLYRKNNFQISKYANRILIMLIAYNIVYLLIKWPLDIIINYSNGLRGWELYFNYFKSINLSIIITGIVGSEHLWYLSGLFYATWILFFLNRMQLKDLTIFLIGLTSFIVMFIPPFDFLLDNLLLYGGFVKGFFFVSMGCWIASQPKRPFKNQYLLLIISFIMLVVIGSNISRGLLYELLLALVVFQLLILAKNYPGEPSLLSKQSRYSLGIYLLHIIFTGIFNSMRSFIPTIDTVNPFLVIIPMLLICIVGSILLYPLTEKYIHQPLIRLFNQQQMT